MYWFRPKRLFKWFAAYYPSSWQGWTVSLALFMFLVYIFQRIAKQFGFGLDAFMAFLPWLVGTLIIFDLLTRLKGEYPWWWKWRG